MSDATFAGNVIVGKNSDRPIFDYQPLVFYLRGKCPTGSKVVPPPKTEEDKFSPDSYWWLSRRLMDKTKGDVIKSLPGYYESRNPLVRVQFDAIAKEMEAELSGVLEKAIKLRNTGGEVAARILDEFTENCVSKVVIMLRELLREFA
ncbi:hypothetical protein ACFLVV_02610 [Chloroflexota bacterium]